MMLEHLGEGQAALDIQKTVMKTIALGKVNTPGMGERIRPMKSVMHSRKPFSMNRLKETLSRPAKAG
jgi:isocitrate/isopropylmalate dehydrogenase